jgi:hypothetical protein
MKFVLCYVIGSKIRLVLEAYFKDGTGQLKPDRRIYDFFVDMKWSFQRLYPLS